MAHTLPGHITLLLPGMEPPAPSDETHIIIPVEFPDMGPYHECLGRFMDGWGRIELQLSLLFQKLLGVDHSRSQALAATLSGKAMIDALTSLSEATLLPDQHRAFVNLMERLSGINTKRNLIVHGHWAAEVFAYNERNGNLTFRMKVVREYPASSRRVSNGLADPKNQRDRSKHIYQTKRIDEATSGMARFASDLSEFVEATFPQGRHEEC